MPLSALRGVLIAALVWLAIAGVAAAEIWPLHPTSIGAWVLFLVVAPPLYLLALAVSEWAWTTRFGRFVAGHPSRAARIAMGVLAGSVGMGLVLVIWFSVSRAR